MRKWMSVLLVLAFLAGICCAAADEAVLGTVSQGYTLVLDPPLETEGQQTLAVTTLPVVYDAEGNIDIPKTTELREKLGIAAQQIPMIRIPASLLEFFLHDADLQD